MGKCVVFAEKPDVGTKLAAILGGCYINNEEMTLDMLSDKKYEGLIKRERASKGYFKCSKKGQEYIVTWGFGHIAELKQAYDYDEKYKKWREELFPFIRKDYEIKLKEDDSIKKHFKLIKELFNDKSTDYIINATDSDKEGSLIFDYAYRLSGSKKPYKRLWINSYTPEAVEDGFANLKTAKEEENLIHAGRCRAIGDLLVGANFTAMATLKYGGFKNMMSIGRVQTPTLAIVVNRELEIQNFKPEDYYELFATFKTDKGEKYIGKWKGQNTDRFTNEKQAKEILSKINKKPGIITKQENTTIDEKPPLLYDLSNLQGDANLKYGFSAQKTLDIVQKLYENQILTYPRTNSRYLPSNLKQEVTMTLNSIPSEYSQFTRQILFKPLNYSKRVFDDSKVESHYAIIPTYKNPSNLTTDEKKIYDLVVKSLIKAFMPSAIWGNAKIETKVENEVFYSSGKVLIDAGWRAVDGKEISSDEDELLPFVKKDEIVKGDSFDILAKKTKAPPRYNEKTLLATMDTAGKFVEDEELRYAMKDHGIGTPATRASIIERLISVGYIVRDKKNLVPTDKGVKVIQTVPLEEIKSPAITGEWEFKLNQIEKGLKSPEEFIEEIHDFVVSNVKKLKSAQTVQIQDTVAIEEVGKCPNCGNSIVKNKKGWGCVNWKSGCKFQIWNSEICGKKLTLSNVKQLLNKGETNLIKGFVSKQDKKFDAYLTLVKDGDGKVQFRF